MKKIVFFLLISIKAFSQGSVKISDMPAATSLTGTEIVPIVQGGINKKATVSLWPNNTIVVSSNTTAVNDAVYTVVASATFTDPTPVEGKGFTVFIRNGTGTVGGTGYSVAGTKITRIFHSGSWANYVGGGAISGLTSGRVTFATSGTTIGDDANLTWNNTNKTLGVGLGTYSLTNKQLQVGDFSIQNLVAGNLLYGHNFNFNGGYKYAINSHATGIQSTLGQLIFQTAPSGTAGDAIPFNVGMKTDYIGQVGLGGNIDTGLGSFTGASMVIKSTGNILMGTTTDDALNKLQVNGDISIGGGSTASKVKFREPSSSGNNFASFEAPSLAADNTYLLPSVYPNVSGQVLTSSSTGTMSWATPFGGAQFSNKINYFGDSFTAGLNATNTSLSFPYIVSNNLFGGYNPAGDYNNYAVSGRGWAVGIANSYTNVTAPNVNSTVVTLGFNDIRRNGNNVTANAKTLEKLKSGARALIANSWLASAVAANNGAVSTTGTWTTVSGIGDKASLNLSGLVKTSIVAGSTLTYTWTGTSLVIGTFSTDEVTTFGGDFTYSIDGGSSITYTGKNKTDGISDGATDNSIIANAIVVTGLTNSSHTVVITTSSTDRVRIDYFGILQNRLYCPSIIINSLAYMNSTGYALSPAFGSDATMNQGSAALEQVVSEFPNFPVYFNDINKFYDITTGLDTDNIHPNDVGHKQIANSILSRISTGVNQSYTPNPIIIKDFNSSTQSFIQSFSNTFNIGFNVIPSAPSIFPNTGVAASMIKSTVANNDSKFEFFTSATNSNLTLALTIDKNQNIITAGGAIGLNGSNYGSSGQVLTSQGSGSAPIWSSVSGGGITNSAANNELMMSNGTNAVPSGVFADATGNLNLGTSLSGATRTISATGSATNVDLIVNVKAGGTFQVESSTGGDAIIQGNTGNAIFQSNAGNGAWFRSGPRIGGNTGTVQIYSGSVTSGNGSSGNVDISTGAPSGTGTESSVNIQTRATGKLGFFNATAVVKQSAVSTSQGIADVLTAYGLLPSSTISSGGTYYAPSTLVANATDANFTATVNGVHNILDGVASANRVITIPTGANGDVMKFYNTEDTRVWSFTGATVYLADRVTVVTELLYNVPCHMERIDGRWIITN
jgi:lysophospholipase L1-like esterase